MKRFVFALLLALGAGACENDDDAIRAEVQGLTLLEGSPSLAAAERLSRHGRRALAPIEAALHTADVSGRKNLLLAVRKIGDGDAVPLLRHLALYDAAPDVRREAEWTLRGWAGAADARGEKARAAVRQLDEQHGRSDAG